MSHRAVPVVLLLVAAVSGGCATDGLDQGETPAVSTAVDVPSTTVTTSPPPGPEWALPGLRFIEALGDAASNADAEALPAFYHPDARVVIGTVGATATGWRQIVDLVAAHPAEPVEADQPVLLSAMGAVVLSPGSDRCGLDACPPAWADVLVMDGTGIAAQLRATSVDPSDDLVAIYEGTAEAYNAHDVDRLLAYYSRADFAPPLPRDALEAVFSAFPAVRAEPVTLADLDLVDSSDPALFDAGSLRGSSRSRTGVGIYRLTLTPETEMLAATYWDLWDGEILSDHTLLDADGLATFLDLSGQPPDPEAWFSVIEVPEPRTPERTHLVEVDGTTIELYDATDTIADLLAWAMDRFDEAGLPAPHVDAVYAETATTCLEGSAWAYTGGESARIRVCLEPEQLVSNDGSLNRLARITMLHELGHVWTAEYLTEDERQAFMAGRGLSAWNEPTAPWVERASEHAAEIMAWGLADEAYELVRLGEVDCDAITEAFRMLTGAEPLHGC